MALNRSHQRLGQQYQDGVRSFIEFVMAKASRDGKIRCPCTECVNFNWYTGEVVKHHLVLRGIMASYKH